MTELEKKELAERIARTCQQCCGMGGHGEHSSIGTKREFWQSCNACNGTGEKRIV